MGHALGFLLTSGYLYCLYQFTRYVVGKIQAAITERRLQRQVNLCQAELQGLLKALEDRAAVDLDTALAIGNPGPITPSALKIESLEPTLRMVTFTMPDWWKTRIHPAPLHALHPYRLMDEALWATRPHIIEEWDLDTPHIGQRDDEAKNRLQQEVWRIEGELSPKGREQFYRALSSGDRRYEESDYDFWKRVTEHAAEFTALDRYNLIKPLAEAEGVI